MLTQLQNAKRVNSAWDVHMEHNLKDDNKNHFQVSFLPDSGYQPSACLSSMSSPSLSHHAT